MSWCNKEIGNGNKNKRIPSTCNAKTISWLLVKLVYATMLHGSHSPPRAYKLFMGCMGYELYGVPKVHRALGFPTGFVSVLFRTVRYSVRPYKNLLSVQQAVQKAEGSVSLLSLSDFFVVS